MPILPEIVDGYINRENAIVKLDVLLIDNAVIFWVINRLKLHCGVEEIRTFKVYDFTEMTAIVDWIKGDAKLPSEVSKETERIVTDGVTESEWALWKDDPDSIFEVGMPR